MSKNTSVKKPYNRTRFIRTLSDSPQRRSFVEALAKTLKCFCEESTFHGLKNLYKSASGLQKSNLSRSKRVSLLISTVLWLTACGLGVSFAIALILLVWNRFQSTPTITTIETNNYPIWNVPFPAVTLCNINKVFKPATENLTEKLVSRGLTDEVVQQFFSNLSKLVQPEYVDDIYAPTLAVLTELNYTTEKLMFELMQPCSVMVENCIWLGKVVPCETIFRVAKSSEGFCCSFNYNALRDNLEVNNDMNSVTEQLNDPIQRVSGAGQFVSLELLLRISMAQYVAYTRSYYGISVLIHSPEDYPQASATTTVAQPEILFHSLTLTFVAQLITFLRFEFNSALSLSDEKIECLCALSLTTFVYLGCDVVLAIIPSVVVSEPAVRGLTLKQRNCYFEDEKKLRTTEKYSFQSCITECAVDTIVKQCGCLPFYYSEVHLNDFVKKTRQCDLQDVGCLRDNRHIISSLQPESVINETLGMNCPDCLPSCSDERYGVQSTIAKRFEGDNLMSLYYSGSNLSNQVTLKVYFKDISCLKYRRDIFMTWDGFLASFGGIFGLCLGGSLISFIEIFYFFSLKLYSSYYGMVDTVSVPELDNRKYQNGINILHVAPFPTDDTLTMRLKFKNKSTMDAIHANAKRPSVSYDRYLD